jgi:signal transduction histidine kinase
MEAADLALQSRKRITIRFQLYASFLLVFLFAAIIATVLILMGSKVEQRLGFMTVASNFSLEIERCRRHEKNYFLYYSRTDLDSALDTVESAGEILRLNQREFTEVLRQEPYASLVATLGTYEELLRELAELPEQNSAEQRRDEIKGELRTPGRTLADQALDLKEKERSRMASMLARSRWIHVWSLILLLIFIVLNASFLGRILVRRINRFQTYAERISTGDFSPIAPVRTYQDEFTDLARAINRMVQELEIREDALVQLHKTRAIGTLTAGVAHELNNPLNNITLTAHMLMEDYDDLSDAERQEMIQDLIGESGRSKKIISNLLDFARESSSQIESLDLVKLVKDTIRLASNQIKLSGVTIEFHAPEYLPRVHGDEQQLQQVFLNLIFNAADASSRGDKITILVVPADEPSYVSVKVMDRGTGIPRHILQSIFDPFFTTKAKEKGTGLGLSVSQGIVGKHGGQISVSSHEGEGTTFTVTLPVTTIADLAVQNPTGV